MWNARRTESSSSSSSPRQQKLPSGNSTVKTTAPNTDRAIGQSRITKGMIFKGEVTGTGPLVIDGSVEGSINLLESHVTVGYNSQVAADITAREIVVMGKILGNITALNLLDIRAEGSVTGKAVAARLTIEEGACFNGSVDTSGHAVGLKAETVLANNIPEHSKTFLVEKQTTGKSILRPLPVSA